VQSNECEGKFRWFSSSWEYPSEQDSEAAGEYRRPTEAEWEAIKRGECPWDDNEWKLTSTRRPVAD
jgi:formylglycine-generating enzyme required for sulfatase activity